MLDVISEDDEIKNKKVEEEIRQELEDQIRQEEKEKVDGVMKKM